MEAFSAAFRKPRYKFGRTDSHPAAGPPVRRPCQDRCSRIVHQCQGQRDGARRRMTDQVEPESEVERTLGTLASLNPAYVLDHTEQQPAAPITIDDLYRTHRMQMVRLAILLVDDISSAEDVVQEAFTGLYRNWGNLR